MYLRWRLDMKMVGRIVVKDENYVTESATMPNTPALLGPCIHQP
jgi:hypothetical protein